MRDEKTAMNRDLVGRKEVYFIYAFVVYLTTFSVTLDCMASNERISE
jgi:hypothetical protein